MTTRSRRRTRRGRRPAGRPRPRRAASAGRGRWSRRPAARSRCPPWSLLPRGHGSGRAPLGIAIILGRERSVKGAAHPHGGREGDGDGVRRHASSSVFTIRTMIPDHEMVPDAIAAESAMSSAFFGRVRVGVAFTMSTPRPDDAHALTRPAGRPGSSVQSVDRAVTLLRAIAASPHPATVWELATRSGINRSTAWRLLSTLEAHGLVERDPLTQRYAIGYTALQLAAGAGHDGLARRVRPILERVAEASGESVMLAAARRFSLVYVDQVNPPGVPWPDWL